MPLAAGARLGPYEVSGSIGAGGMGEVYRARDPRLGRDVAIKVLPPHLASDPDSLARFEREARAVASLSHPNILAIYDVGSDGGLTYAVMELLEGETLRSRLDRGALPWRDAAEIAAEIADGLATAHAKGIVHRDLKPENIFLTTDGRPKVLDFGLALHSLTGPAETETIPATRTVAGNIMGTVGYMSPEQVRGQTAGAPSDMFSFGCVLYEMVAGQRAFARETAAQTMTAILEQPPPPFANTNAPPPPALERVIGRCLEKDPGARMHSARDLAVTLRNIARGSNGTGAVPSRSRSRLGRKSILRAALLVPVAAALFTFYYRSPSGSPNSIAILPFTNASGNPDLEYLSDGITEGLINSLAQAPKLNVMSRNAVFRYKGREIDARDAGRELEVAAVLSGRVVQRGDNLSITADLIDVETNHQLWGDRFEGTTRDILSVQERISTAISQKLQLQLTSQQKERIAKHYTENTEAYQLYLRGRYYWNKKNADGFYKGIEYFQKAIDLDPDFAPAYAAIAACYTNLANYNFALIAPREAWIRAKTAATRAIQIDDTLAAGHAALAIVTYQWEWDWPGAEREFQRAIALDPGSASTYEPTPSSTLHWYSHFLMTMRRTQESFQTGRHALDLEPLDLANNAHQGWYYLWTRDYDLAVEPLKKAIALSPNFPVSQWYLGLVYEQKGMYKEAIDQFQNSVRITGGLPSMLARLGHAYAAAGRQTEAEAILDQLRALSKQNYVPSYPVAAIYAALGRKDEAFTWLERAYDERDSWMVCLPLDPRLDSLRSDARFALLLQRIDLS